MERAKSACELRDLVNSLLKSHVFANVMHPTPKSVRSVSSSVAYVICTYMTEVRTKAKQRIHISRGYMLVSICWALAVAIWAVYIAILLADPQSNWTAIGGAATSIGAIATAASAAGAFFAAHVALDIGQRQEKIRISTGELLATLAAVELLPVIKQMKVDIRTLQGELLRARKKLSMHDRFRPDPIYERHLRSLSFSLADQISLEHVTLIASSAPEAAKSLAAARSLIRILHQEIVQRGIDWTEIRRLQNEYYEPDQDEWRKLAARAESELTLAEHGCEKLATRPCGSSL
ncbi:hypothetical protein IAG25_15790 [Caballeronia sp. EK]|uniref:hypothetical protein n=1 Tax=Caballeronia sp. EK TaxID=2767469 RepID=UPI0016550721|nr:hypothetical protein [Caballeronia sp. EK]MBC8638282.1 hypothetical protein [Caballeronia sp. EK]